MKFSLLLFATLAGAPSLLAQEATPPLVPAVPQSQSIMDTLINAGPVMIPLFLLSIFFRGAGDRYIMTIRRGAVVSSGYMATADALAQTRLSGIARRFQSARRSHRAGRAKNARFHDQEPEFRFSAGP